MARSVPGTDGGQYPFWSPDSQAIGFFASGQLERIDLASGAVHVIAMTPLGGRGGTWSDQWTILFASGSTGGLRGCAPEPMTLAPRTPLGGYEILSLIGQGGMLKSIEPRTRSSVVMSR